MASVVVYGHGGRGKGGTSTGTYVVPKGVKIYFFVADGELLAGGPADGLAKALITTTPNEPGVQGLADNVKSEFETVPNYICLGDNGLIFPSGIHRIGVDKSKSLMMAIPGGTTKRLSDIVGGSGNSKGAVGANIYWLCCREVLTGANSISYGPKSSKKIGGDDIPWTGQVTIKDTGLKPSQVKKTGQWQKKAPF